MTTNKIDYMLRDLEKQVQDFTLQSMKESRPDSDNTNSDNVPLRHYRAKSNDEDALDDNVCIGTILQRSATARRPEKPVTNLVPHSKSLRLKKREEFSMDNEELSIAMRQVLSAPETEKSPVSRVKTLTTRIYIDDAKTHKVVQLTNLLTSAMVVQYLRKKGLLDHSDDWTLFEIDNIHNVERPLREWEIVLDILNVWDIDASNALLVKKYSYHYTLTADSILQKKINPMHGWVSIEYKKGKWQKRFCFVKENAIYHSKDTKGSNPSILCSLASYDIYTLLQPLKISPTPFVFAIRAQDKSSIFERESDYMRYMAVENQEEMENWVLCIRCVKSTIQYQHHPNRVTNPLSPDTSSSIRRQKSMKEMKQVTDHPPPIPTTTIPRSESTRRAGDDKRPLARSGTTRHRTTTTEEPHVVEESSTFVKGSLLAKEETPEQILYRQQQQQQHHYEESNPNTLIQIDDRIKFSKGSLLDKNQIKMTRSKSVKEPSHHASPEQVRRHQSLKRKPTKRQHHDVPLPNNAAIASLPAPPTLNNDTSQHARRYKTLLNFDE